MKKKAKRAVRSVSDSPMPFKEPKRASIEKAGNGYIVSSGYGQKQMIAKDLKEATALLDKMMK